MLHFLEFPSLEMPKTWQDAIQSDVLGVPQ